MIVLDMLIKDKFVFLIIIQVEEVVVNLVVVKVVVVKVDGEGEGEGEFEGEGEGEFGGGGGGEGIGDPNDGTGWEQLGQDIDGEEGSLTGYSVYLNNTGTRLAVGSPITEVVKVELLYMNMMKQKMYLGNNY